MENVERGTKRASEPSASPRAGESPCEDINPVERFRVIGDRVGRKVAH